jgi:hypothetical protein
MNREEIVAWVIDSRASQGLSDKITDPDVLNAIARVLVNKQGPAHPGRPSASTTTTQLSGKEGHAKDT